MPGKNAKTRPNPVSVPLIPIALDIIDKYNLPGGLLVPPISNQKYNDYLKELFELAGLDRPVVQYNEFEDKNEVIPLYKLAGSHMARRTFVGILHKTAKNEVIASMTGHAKNSRAFQRYYNVDEEDRKNAISDL